MSEYSFKPVSDVQRGRNYLMVTNRFHSWQILWTVTHKHKTRFLVSSQTCSPFSSHNLLSAAAGDDRGTQWEVSGCWKLSKTLTLLAPSRNNENIWFCYFPQFTSEWVVAAAQLSLYPPERSQGAALWWTAPLRICPSQQPQEINVSHVS